MSAFSSLGNVQQATLAMVHREFPKPCGNRHRAVRGDPAWWPTTASRPGDAPEMRFDAFIEEFSTILQRHASRVTGPPRVRSASHGTNLARAAADGEINVVPYIDVMLVLLIIFMITAPLLTQGVKVDLPKAGANLWRRNGSNRCVISGSRGRLYLNIAAIRRRLWMRTR